MKRYLCAWVLLVALGYAGSLPAHVRSESFSRWQFNGHTLSMRFTVASREVSRIPQAAPVQTPSAVLANYLKSHVAIDAPRSGCGSAPRFMPLHVRPAYLQIEAVWECTGPPAALTIRAFFDLAAEHTHFASFESAAGLKQRLVTAENPVWNLQAPSDNPEKPGSGSSRFSDYVLAGIGHITSGMDHMLFLLALLLVCRSGRDILWAVTGFTAGHSVTLSLAALGLVLVNLPAIEATIGLSIALVAAERTAVTLKTPTGLALAGAAGLLLLTPFSFGHGANLSAAALTGLALVTFCYLYTAHKLAGHGAYRILLTALFGMAHGFGFAGAFVASHSGIEIRPATLAGFNIGVEIGQLALLAAVMLAAMVFKNSHLKYSLPLGLDTADLGSAVVFGFGVFWFVQRSLF